jgi:putative acyl-CoA dehydrogenase
MAPNRARPGQEGGMDNTDPRARAPDNQPPPLPAHDAYATDAVLREAVAREGGDWADASLHAYGALSGGELQALAAQANATRPVFRPVDAHGRRIDHVEFHPAYHRLMQLAVSHGVTGFAWRHDERPGAHVARAALMFLHYQADQGSACPLTMTYACVPTLRAAPASAGEWLARSIAPAYDGTSRPAAEKAGNTVGMGMTEKQGGSDVRSNRTRAEPAGDGMVALSGHKWFWSAPMCDAHLVLAQSADGLGCYLLPRIAPDGALNGVRIQRLKDKLGDWSNASAEVEFERALAWPVGDPARGVATILSMVALTRLDCLTGSAALMRQALVQALHHARHRVAFGRRLVDQPLMRNVLADLALESEAATALAMRVARAVDAAPRDEGEAALARVTTALGKYWVCKRATPFVNEAQECLGGLGYVEDGPLARLLRQAPLNSIWEGSGNIQCLDVLRALRREPGCRDALFAEFGRARGADARLDAEVARLSGELDADDGADAAEARARWLAERLAIAMQAAILLRGDDGRVADAFCASRLGERRGLAFGTLAPGIASSGLLARAFPT